VRPRVILALVAAAALGIAAGPSPKTTGGKGFHPLTDHPTSCGICHEGEVVRGRDDRTTVRLKKDPVSLCIGCHPSKDFVHMHPVDLKPDFAVPPKLPLDRSYLITCVTCHDPHASPWSDEPVIPRGIRELLGDLLSRRTRFPSYFLRMANRDGELCRTCHEPGRIGLGDYQIDRDFLGRYVGSAACAPCHKEIYEQWRLTPHARMVRDPRRDPLAIAGALPDPSVDLAPEEISLALGSHWTQRYLVEREGELFVTPFIWNMQTKHWDTSCSFNRRWAVSCAGCHTTGYFAPTGKYQEAGIGCEACHGPGKAHAAGGKKAIVNPAKLSGGRGLMVCMACHTNGHDPTGSFAFPVGYEPGKDLAEYFKGLFPKPGQPPDSYVGDGSTSDRVRQYAWYLSILRTSKGTTCDLCEDYRVLPQYREGQLLTIPQHCGTCHAGAAASFDSPEPGIDCLACHPPTKTKDGERYSIHDHRFLPGAPLRRPAVTPGPSPHRATRT
jgi:hypothetical protein